MKINYVFALTISLLLLFFLTACTQQQPTAPSEPVPTSAVPASGSEEVQETVVISSPTKDESAVEAEQSVASGSQDYIVDMTSSGFKPTELTIKAGDTVTFLNRDTRTHWPATAVHPSHTIYPGSDIAKCSLGTEEIFDSCEGIPQGEQFSFTFTEKGDWRYHDHLRPSMTGTIIVE